MPCLAPYSKCRNASPHWPSTPHRCEILTHRQMLKPDPFFAQKGLSHKLFFSVEIQWAASQPRWHKEREKFCNGHNSHVHHKHSGHSSEQEKNIKRCTARGICVFATRKGDGITVFSLQDARVQTCDLTIMCTKELAESFFLNCTGTQPWFDVEWIH